MTTRRTFLAGGLTAAVAATLAACSSDVPTTPEETGTPAAQPVLDSDRLTTVLSRVQKGLDAADKAKDAKKLDGYLTGPAERVRGEEYTLATKSKDDSHVHDFDTTSQAGAVGLTTGFPRTALTITEGTKDDSVPYLLALTQDSARDDFELWGWTRLYAGVEVPATSNASVGSTQVDADTTGFTKTPAEVLDAYVDALNKPDGSNGKAFTDDPIRQRVKAERAVDLGGMGEVTVKASAGKDGFKGLVSTEDGAIVLTTLSFTTEYKNTVAGSTIDLGEPVSFLMGDDTSVKGTVTAHYDAMVAFSIPVKDSKDKPVVLGGELVLAKVDRDDSKAPKDDSDK